MRVLWVIPNLSFGGAQTALARITQALADRVENHVVAFNEEGLVIRPHGVFHSLEVSGGRTAREKLGRFAERVVRLRRLKQALRPDVAVSFLEGADYVNVLSRQGEAVVCAIRGSKLDDIEIAGALGVVRKRVLMPLLYPRADLVLTVSEGLQRQMRSAFAVPQERLACIYNMYDLAELRARSEEPLPLGWNWLGDRPLFVSHGRLHVAKGYDALLRAFAQLARGTARLLLVGDGPLREPLTQEATALGLRVGTASSDSSADVVFAGYQANPLPWIRRATVYCLPSLYEGFPNALAEAMALGVPVVASDCPTGPREILAPGSGDARELTEIEWADFGLLLPRPGLPSSERVWSSAMGRLLNDPQLRANYAERGRKRVEAFSVAALTNQWAEVLSKIAKTRSRRR